MALSFATAAPAIVALAGCEKEKPIVAAEDAGAGAAPQRPAQRKFGAAVAAAESGSGQAPSGSAPTANGPPETGVFAPGAADAARRPALRRRSS